MIVARSLKNKTVVFVKHCYPVDRDTRLIKLIGATREGGYSVILLLWDHCEELREYKHLKNNCEEFVLRLKVPYGIKSIPFWPIWWLFVLQKLVSLNWDIAYAIDLPSIIPVLFVSQLRRRSAIYEIENSLIDQVIVPELVRSVLLTAEKIYASLYNIIVLVDELQIQELNFPKTSKIVIIYDSAIDILKEYTPQIYKNKFFNIFYAGMLFKGKKLNLDKLIAAIRNMEGVRVIFAGYGDLTEQIEKLSKEMPNKVEFLGRISYQEVLERSLKCDLLFVLRDPILPINRYICGSKLMQAMMCGKPILVNKGTSTAIKVLREKCGVVVDANEVSEIKEAILKLKNNRKLCKTLGMNGRRAYEQKYSWELMSNRLLNLYSELVRSSC